MHPILLVYGWGNILRVSRFSRWFLSCQIFFVLRKKFNQASFLHVYHHTVMIGAGYIACRFSLSKCALSWFSMCELLSGEMKVAGTPFSFTPSRWPFRYGRHPQLLCACRYVLVLPVHLALPRREGATLGKEEFNFTPTGKTIRPLRLAELSVRHSGLVRFVGNVECLEKAL